ncbi:hypothetical protein F5Y18DRAFT_379810 [Xylariaceae sp. FL1019]|nr:hypothetical protein F5Y18DRAFT_379810 [Xylariaceae sp. FL1019]
MRLSLLRFFKLGCISHVAFAAIRKTVDGQIMPELCPAQTQSYANPDDELEMAIQYIDIQLQITARLYISVKPDSQILHRFTMTFCFVVGADRLACDISIP